MSVIPQDEYIAILFADCGYHTVLARREWLKASFGRRYADELTPAEKSRCIELLKGEKELGL